MQDEDDATDRGVGGIQDRVEQTRADAALVRDVSREVSKQGTTAGERAAMAKRRELAAHQRAIELHERAAELQEHLGHVERAANASKHAEHARELLAKGRVDQHEQER